MVSRFDPGDGYFLPFGAAVPTTWADERLYALNLYAGWMTSNHWGEFCTNELDFEDSYLVTAALARCIGAYEDKRNKLFS